MRLRPYAAPFFAVFAAAFAAQAAPPVEFVSPAPEGDAPVTSDQGYLTLRWRPESGENPKDLSYELQQAAAPAFDDPATRYLGPDLGSVLTGFAEGRYYFRVRSIGPEGETGPWSESLPFAVEYMPMRRVLLYLATGAIVFALTVGAVVRGHRRARLENALEKGGA